MDVAARVAWKELGVVEEGERKGVVEPWGKNGFESGAPKNSFSHGVPIAFVPYAFHLEDKLFELRTPVAPPETDVEIDW